MPLALGLLFGALAASAVVLGAGIVVALSRRRHAILLLLVAFATGTLAGAALLGLLPELANRLPLSTVGGLALLGMGGFFLLEKVVLWRQSRDAEHKLHSSAGYLILIGDGVHNAADGLLLGAALVADPWLGVTVGLALIAHEIPQEVGDFVLLLESGLSQGRALAYNLLSSATIFPGVLIGVLLAETVEPLASLAMAVTLGGFLYVALADLVPHLHERIMSWHHVLVLQILPLLAGVTLIWMLGRLES